MDKNQLIKEVKLLVGEAKVDQAFEKLLAFFEANPKYNNFDAYALQIKALFEKTSKDEELGIISNDQAKASYNKVNYQMLELLKHVENDDFNWRPKKKSSQLVVSISITSVILLLVGSFFVFKWLQADEPDTSQNLTEVCPEFEKDTKFNILVFPYSTYDDNKLKPHQAILDRLNDLSRIYNINLGIDYFYAEENQPAFPKNDRQFSDRAAECRANLAIWGRSEELDDQTILRTQYKFLDVENSFSFNKIKLTEDTEIDTVRSISSIANNGTVTENIEQVILLLFGIVAYETADQEAAIAVLEQVELPDSAATLLRGMALADSYLAKNQTTKAAEVYDKVLEEHPNYWFALNNRGMIKYQEGEYEQSIADLTETIKLRPEDTTALSVRGAAYTKTEQLSKAKKDLDKAKELDPGDRSIDAKLEDWNKKEVELQKRNIQLEREIRQRPNNIQALNSTAQTNFSLGDYSKSLQYSEKAISTNPRNIDAYATKIKSLLELGKQEEAKASLEEAIKNGINGTDLLKQVPEFKLINQSLPVKREN